MADKANKYVVNMTFDGGDQGEIIAASPTLIADWIEAGFVSPVDENGNRLIKAGRSTTIDEGAAPAGDPASLREVTADDLATE